MDEKQKLINDLELQAIENNHLRAVLKTLTKDYKIQAHDYKIIEDKDFKGKIIDVGAGPGVLGIVAMLKNPELNITIMDGSRINLEIARTLAFNAKLKTKFDLIQGLIGYDIADNMKNAYDVVVMNHVVEHVKDLDMLFKWAEELLKDDGTLFIAVPYMDCHFSPNHVHFFDVKDGTKCSFFTTAETTNIVKVIKRNNFDGIIEIFDEEKIDERHPNKSHGQLDMFIKVKKNENYNKIRNEN